MLPTNTTSKAKLRYHIDELYGDAYSDDSQIRRIASFHSRRDADMFFEHCLQFSGTYRLVCDIKNGKSIPWTKGTNSIALNHLQS